MSDLVSALGKAQEEQQHASDALARLPNSSLITLSRSTQLSPEMAVIAGTLCLLLGRKPTWGNAQDMLCSGKFPIMADKVRDDLLDAITVRKVASLVKSNHLARFVRSHGGRPVGSSRILDTEVALARWVVSISAVASARRRIAKLKAKEAAADGAAEGRATTSAAATAAAAAPAEDDAADGIDGDRRRRLVRRSSSLRQLRRSGVPQVLDSVEEKPSREEESMSTDRRTPRDPSSARSSARKPGDVPPAVPEDASATGDGAAISSPRPVDANLAIEALEGGIPALKYKQSSSWFGKRSAPRVVWLYRSPATDVLGWGKPGMQGNEPAAGKSIPVRDIKRVGYGLLTPLLRDHGDRSRAELHVVVEASSGELLQLLMHSAEDRDTMLAAVGGLLAMRK